MRPEESEKALRQFLKSVGKTLKDLTASDVLQVATEFWRPNNLEGARTENGDGLVAYFELMNRGRGVLYEFGVNRVMTAAPEGDDYSPWLPSFKLRLSVSFKPTLQVFQLSPVTASIACWNKHSVGSFLEEVRASPQFQVVAACTQHSSGIALSECAAPWGNPVHPTQGLTWAIA